MVATGGCVLNPKASIATVPQEFGICRMILQDGIKCSANKHSTTESYTVKIQQIDMSKTVPRFAGGCPYHEQKIGELCLSS